MKRERHRNRREGRSGALYPAVIASLFLFFLSSMAYLYALNRGATGGYAVREAEIDIERLTEENRKLKLSEAQVLSLARIEESVRTREMDRVAEMRTIGNRGVVAIR